MTGLQLLQVLLSTQIAVESVVSEEALSGQHGEKEISDRRRDHYEGSTMPDG